MAEPKAVISNFFSKIDVDGDGSVTLGEMDTCFKLFDKDGDGKLSSTEWSAGFVSNFSGTAEQAEKLFHHMDKTGSGQITPETLHDLFKSMDSDGNGTVSKDEFHDYWIKVL